MSVFPDLPADRTLVVAALAVIMPPEVQLVPAHEPADLLPCQSFGLKLLAQAREETGLAVDTEVMSVRDVDVVARYADVLQIGARNAQNFILLEEVGRTGKPVLLKRGLASTIEDWLLAAEYILHDSVEERLGIAPWTVAPNANNSALARGASSLGIRWGAIRRNVRQCWNLGYCGLGCPTNAKQSMLVTTIPHALDRGATLVTRARAMRLVLRGDAVDSLESAAMDASGTAPSNRRIRVRARLYIAAAGAIGSPALLLRSSVPDPYAQVGIRTFLHPTVVSAALMPERVDGFAGAPQTVYSDHYLESVPIDGPVGFKLEAPPVHPVLAAITLPSHGSAHAAWMQRLPHMQVLIALLRDGFHRDSAGGRVRLARDGTPLLDYALTPYLLNGARRAMIAMAELQFAAGATSVMPVHDEGDGYPSLGAARAAISAFDLRPRATTVVSAHVMGGCALGPDPRRAVVDETGRHHHLANLYVVDGSLFPTSIGANPQLSIYAIAAKLATGITGRLRT